jgi:hypothetical protein
VKEVLKKGKDEFLKIFPEYEKLLAELGGSLGEYVLTRQVNNSLQQLWRFPHIRQASSCLSALSQCQ